MGVQCADCQVVLDDIASFSALHEEVAVSMDKISNVVGNSKLIDALDGNYTSHRMMNCIAKHL